MKNRVFIVSRFEGVKKKMNQFHFLGFYRGLYIKKIFISGGSFDKDEEYVMAVNVLSCKDNYIYGELLKSKKLFI